MPLSAFATTRWVTGPMQTVRYNGYPAMRISGSPAPGYSTGAAMDEMERLAAQLPAGFAYEWTGQSREERLAGSQALVLYGFAILAVFLALAALYESWSIPLAVLLVVPLGVLGALAGVSLRDMPNDVYLKVGLITIIGLSSKNAILIIEFAKDQQAQGKSLDRRDDGAAAPALPADTDDLARVHPRRACRWWCRRARARRASARDRHRRDGRHDHGDGAGGAVRAGLLRRRAPGVFSKGSHATTRSELQAEAAKNRQIDPGEGATPAKEGA